MVRLALQHPYQIAVAHWGERMVLHAGFGKQLIAHKKVTPIHRPAALGKGRTDQGECRSQGVEQGVRHRSNISPVGGIEGGANLEVALFCSTRLQPAPRLKGLRHSLLGIDGARLECDHHGLRCAEQRQLRRTEALAIARPEGRLEAWMLCPGRGARHTKTQNRRPACTHKVVRQVRCASEIVGDAAQCQAGCQMLSNLLGYAWAIDPCNAFLSGLHVLFRNRHEQPRRRAQ